MEKTEEILKLLENNPVLKKYVIELQKENTELKQLVMELDRRQRTILKTLQDMKDKFSRNKPKPK